MSNLFNCQVACPTLLSQYMAKIPYLIRAKASLLQLSKLHRLRKAMRCGWNLRKQVGPCVQNANRKTSVTEKKQQSTVLQYRQCKRKSYLLTFPFCMRRKHWRVDSIGVSMEWDTVSRLAVEAEHLLTGGRFSACVVLTLQRDSTLITINQNMDINCVH